MSKIESGKSSGRPREFDLKAGVETAMALFWAKGYDGVSTAALGRAIGINPPSLYAAYGSKRGLFERALARYQETHGAFFSRLKDPREPLAEVLEAVLRDAIAVYTFSDANRGCLVLDGARNCGDLHVRAVTGAIASDLHARIKRLASEESPDNADAIADYALFLLHGLSASARAGASRLQLGRNLDQAIVGLRSLFPQRR